MQKLASAAHVIDFISEWTGRIVSFTVVLIIVAALYIVAQRIFRFSTGFDLLSANKILFVYIIFGGAYSLRARAHVNVDVLHDRLSHRAQSIVDMFTSLFFFLFLIVMLWMATKTALTAAPGFHPAASTFLPQNWPTTILAPFGISLFILQGLAEFLRNLITVITGKVTP
jgi:TRAP-type mannitol/chloroaromatic compound transport system permease small subunit